MYVCAALAPLRRVNKHNCFTNRLAGVRSNPSCAPGQVARPAGRSFRRTDGPKAGKEAMFPKLAGRRTSSAIILVLIPAQNSLHGGWREPGAKAPGISPASPSYSPAKSGLYSYKAWFIHIHSLVPEQIREGLTLLYSASAGSWSPWSSCALRLAGEVRCVLPSSSRCLGCCAKSWRSSRTCRVRWVGVGC